MARWPMFFRDSVTAWRVARSSSAPAYNSLGYAPYHVRHDVHAELMGMLRRGVRLPRRLLDVVRGTGGQVLKHRGRVAGYVFDHTAFPLSGYFASYILNGEYLAAPSAEMIGRHHPSMFADGCAVIVDSYELNYIGTLVALPDVRMWMIGGAEYRRMVDREDRDVFSYYWYEESDLEPMPYTTDGGHVWNLPQVVRVQVTPDDVGFGWEEEEEREPGRGGWDCGIGNHDLKRRYEGPVLGVELEVDSNDRRELGELCASVGIHTCRDGSLDDDSGIELVAAPLDWAELRGESSPWGRVFADGDFDVHDPEEYGIHVSLNRRAISRGAQARIFYALNRWRSLESVFGRGATGYASKVSGTSKDVRKLAYNAILSGTGKYQAANFSSRERLEVRCIAATSDWRKFRARVGLVDALRLFAEYAGWGMFTGDNFQAFLRERCLDSHPEAVAAYCGVSRRSGRPLVSEVF